MPSRNLFRHEDSADTSKFGEVRVVRYVETGKDVKLGRIRIRKVRGEESAEPLLSTCLITRVHHQKSVAHQAEPTISGHLYISSFGDEPTSYSITGMGFDNVKCTGTGTDVNNTSNITSGAEALQDCPLTAIIDFYHNFKLGLSDNVEDHITVTTYDTLRNTSMNYGGILHHMSIDIAAEPNGTRRYDFTYTFLAIT